MEYNSARLSDKQFVKIKVLTYFHVLISEGTDACFAWQLDSGGHVIV